MNLSSSGSVPTKQMEQLLGPVSLSPSELTSFANAIQQRHPNVVRYRREVLDLPFEGSDLPWYRLARKIANTELRPSRYLAYALGDYYIQDAGSLLALSAARADTDELSEGMLVCDLCAAPGGKASAILEAIGQIGFLLANEPIRSRLAALQFNLARTGSDRYAISALDPSELANQLAGQFDMVLVDAPCSGQALLGRGKQSQSSLSMKQVEHSAARQERILDAAVELLKPDGRLIYSTCTFAHAENEQQISRLIANERVRAEPIAELATYASSESATYRLWPHRHGCAGSFAASTVATTGGQPLSDNNYEKKKRKKKNRPSVLPIDLSDWYEIENTDFKWKNTDSVIYVWSNDAPSWVTEIATSGPEAAFRTSQTWKPSHAGALRRQGLLKAKQLVDVDQEIAAKYFRGESIPCLQKGWQVVRCDEKPIGWTKASHSVGKNQLPTAARFNFDLEY